MKFKVEWSMGCEAYLDILNVFSSMTPEQRADVGDGVTMIGRWHDTNSRSGVAIMETTDLAALNRYLGQWNPFMDLDITPVLDARGNSRTREGRPRRPQRLSHRTDTAVIAGSVLLAGVAICETLDALYERFINRDRRQEEPP